MGMLRALRGRSPAELRDRLAQWACMRAERAGLGIGARNVRAGDIDLRSSTADPGFAAGFRDRWPAEADAIVHRAERLLDGKYDLLGYESLDFGAPPDWQLDPVSGKRAELVHWSLVPYLDHGAVGDHKVTWELNRHQWIMTLAQAWCLTGRAEFAGQAATMLDNWLLHNPPKKGINWASSLELAFRIMAWSRVLHLLHGSDRPGPELRQRLAASIDLQGRHVERYLSTWFSPNTHLTGEALALLHVGVALPGLPRAAHWREKGWRILEREVERQLRPDGVYFEQTSWYQGYTVDFYLHAIRLRWASGGDVPASLLDRVSRAAHALAAITLPNGRIPLLGDDDGGRLLPLRPGSLDDFRDTLALAALVLGDPSLKPNDDAPASILPWIATARDLERYDAMPAAGGRSPSEAFPDGGWYVVRDHRSTLVMDGGPHGSLSGAHAHADALSVVLAVDGTPVLGDSGTYTYLGSERDSFRGTAAHNTVEVNGEDSSVPGGPFRWERFARSEVTRWFDVGGQVLWEAVHDGYGRFDPAILHRRTVLWLRNRYGIVCDLLEGPVGGGVTMATVRYHSTAQSVIVTASPADTAEFRFGGKPMLRLLADSPIGVEDGWSSELYGRRTRVDVAVLRPEAGRLTSSVTVLVPGASAEGPTACTRDGDGAWSVTGEGFHDRFLIRGHTAIGTERLRTDLDICWVREEDGMFIEVVGAGAGSLQVDGEPVLTVRGGCARAVRDAAGTWTLEEN